MNSKEKIKTAKKHGVINNKNAEKKIDSNGVYKLALKFWTKSEIASFYDCHADTITNRFQDIYTKGIEQGKAKLRDIQMKSAVHGNVTMQIWLGKQYLNQIDKVNVNGLSDEETERLRQIANKEMENNL